MNDRQGVRMQNKNISPTQIFFLVLFTILVSLFFTKTPGSGNMDTWVSWIEKVDTLGLVKGFSATEADYPPLTLVPLLLSSFLSQTFGIWVYLAIKIVLLVFLFLTVFIFWLWKRDFLLSFFLFFALLLNSLAHGHLDVFFAPTLILALWALERGKWVLFISAFMLSCLTKWQPLILAPMIAIFLLGIHKIGDLKKIEISALLKKIILPAGLIIALVVLVFGFKPLGYAIKNATHHAFISANALNLNWILTYFMHVMSPEKFGPLVDGRSDVIRTFESQYRLVPQMLFILTYLSTLAIFFKREKTFENLILFSLLGYLSYYMFNPGVHENHFFIPMVLSILLFAQTKKHLFITLFLTLIGNVNLLIFNGMDGVEISFERVFSGLDLSIAFAIMNLVFFSCVWAQTIFSKSANKGSTIEQPY